MTTLPPPTDDSAGLVALLGAEATLKLGEARGGVRIYVGGRDSGALAEIVGVDAATALHARYGREDLKVPIARPWRVLCYLAMGLSQERAALKAGCSTNTVVRAIRNFGHPDGREPETRRQLDLFDKTG